MKNVASHITVIYIKKIKFLMEAELPNDKFEAYEHPNNGEELERKLYGNDKIKETLSKKKARTENSQTEKVNKSVLKKINKEINPKRKQKVTAVKNKKKNSSNKKIFFITKNKKRARTPIKAKHPFIVSRVEDIEKVQIKRNKKFKNDTESDTTEATDLDDFPEKYDNSNLLNDYNILDEMERDEKIGKEGLLGLQEILFNGDKPEEERGQEMLDSIYISFYHSTQACTILLKEN